MFALTVDQVGSRRDADRVGRIADHLRRTYGDVLLLGPDRTAGDEFQLLVGDAAAALTIMLDLARNGGWSIGIGVGAVETPLPPTAREARGPAFTAARDAVDRAKRSPHRVAVTGTDREAADAEAVVALLLDLRSRRTPEGWEVADRLEGGATQAEVAEGLGVTPQAVSLRARAAGLRADRTALPTAERLLAAVDAPSIAG